MKVTVLSIRHGEREGLYLLDLLANGEAHQFTARVQADLIHGQRLLTTSGDLDMVQAFGTHARLHGQVLKLVSRTYAGEPINLPIELADD